MSYDMCKAVSNVVIVIHVHADVPLTRRPSHSAMFQTKESYMDAIVYVVC